MYSIKGAIRKASSILKHIDAVEEFDAFFVVIDNHVPEMDSSANMVAVEKSSGECCNFVSVITELGELRHTYTMGEDGSLKEIPNEDA